MPFKSIAQQRYFNTHKAELKRQGVNVAEWNQASTGLKLPKRVKPAKSASMMLRVKPAKTSMTLGQAQKMRAKTYKLGK